LFRLPLPFFSPLRLFFPFLVKFVETEFDGVEAPEFDTDSELSTVRFLFFGGAALGGDSEAGIDFLESESESESESDSEDIETAFAACSSALRFSAFLDVSWNLMCALALSLASRSALSRSNFSFPA
jgi:hypothetical protein